ncbi:hypothetical protein FQA39_LY08320 [Lamprigera yunnana]|nr:hypothetical protein FQA39_LY08320 [Lamprigera yunnana]
MIWTAPEIAGSDHGEEVDGSGSGDVSKVKWWIVAEEVDVDAAVQDQDKELDTDGAIFWEWRRGVEWFTRVYTPFVNRKSTENVHGVISRGVDCGLGCGRSITFRFSCDMMYSCYVTSGRNYAAAHHRPCPLMYSYYDVEYFGTAQGICSILQMLLSVPGYLDANPVDANDSKATVDYLLHLQDDKGNSPTSASDEIEDAHELVHWCQGAPDMADLEWHKGLLKKGPGICHGIAGNGYLFLLLYRLTKDKKYDIANLTNNKIHISVNIDRTKRNNKQKLFVIKFSTLLFQPISEPMRRFRVSNEKCMTGSRLSHFSKNGLA